jgi:processive 1,2-diacylglycerol beta-glucosyltransferase
MRVLIATVTAGAGHVQAAAALEEAWRSCHPEDTLERLDVLSFVSRLHRKLYSEGYVKVVERAPELYSLVFKKTDNPKLMLRLTRLRRILAGRSTRKFVAHVKSFKPDIALCTHFLPLEILGGMKASSPTFRPLVACVVTDFEAHAFWMEPGVDHYFVATNESKARMIARGIDRECVSTTGIPVAARFSEMPDRRAVRKRMGLRDDLPTLLVLGGGFGMGPVAEILAELDKIAAPLQTVVVAGRNEELKRELASRDYKHPTRVLGFVTNMHELMAASELIITKPGGLTTSEALALGKPLMILNPIPGQEAANSDYLLQHGAAEKINRVEDLPYRLEQLLGSKKLAAMSKSAKSLGRPDAALKICSETRAIFETGRAAARVAN